MELQNSASIKQLAELGYWPAWAYGALTEGRYSEAVQLCKQHLPEDPDLVSGRVLYARALYHVGRLKVAEEEFYHVLLRDPENLVALKYLGDIKFAQGDECAAFANYEKVLEIDPHCHGLAGALERQTGETTTTITLHHAGETAGPEAPVALRQVPFVTETMGDLYLAQGHSRLAAAVFRSLQQQAENPRLAEKLAQAERTAKEKDRKE